MCCKMDDSQGRFGVDILPAARRDHMIMTDMKNTIADVAAMCSTLGVDEEHASPIDDLILWRLE